MIGLASLRSREHSLHTIASSQIVSLQNGHSMEFTSASRGGSISFLRASPDEALTQRARLERVELVLRFRDARPQLFDLAFQLAAFFEQGFRNPEISRAMFAHESVVSDLAGAKRAFHGVPRYGEIFRMKFADPDRPSLSLTSTRMG